MGLLYLLPLLASVNEAGDSQCILNAKHHTFQVGLETNVVLNSIFQEAGIFYPYTG